MKEYRQYNSRCVSFQSENPSALLDGNSRDYDGNKGYSYHYLGSGNLTIQLGTSAKFLLLVVNFTNS